MDAPGVNPRDLERSLKFIRRINWFLGYSRTTLGYLRQFSKGWKSSDKISVLDVATGSADIPGAISVWARNRSMNVSLLAVDRHPHTARVAFNRAGNLDVVQADARALPFADQSVDYVMTAMFIHHLSEADVVAVLKEMNRVARRGIIVSDLLRHKRAYAWITLFTLFANPMVVHDARVSVAQAFTKAEILELCRAAGLGYVKYRRHFGHRFVISGEKSEFGKSHRLDG